MLRNSIQVKQHPALVIAAAPSQHQVTSSSGPSCSYSALHFVHSSPPLFYSSRQYRCSNIAIARNPIRWTEHHLHGPRFGNSIQHQHLAASLSICPVNNLAGASSELHRLDEWAITFNYIVQGSYSMAIFPTAGTSMLVARSIT